MSRSTQIMGLNERAERWLENNNRLFASTCDCPDCKTNHVQKRVFEVYDTKTGVSAGMFDDGPNLCKYQLKDESWIYEYVQEVPWASGPVIFLALRDEKGIPLEESTWTEDEIQKSI